VLLGHRGNLTGGNFPGRVSIFGWPVRVEGDEAGERIGHEPKESIHMPQYMLSVHMVEGEVAPSEEEMQQAYKDVDVVNAKMQKDGVWVFAGGLEAPTTATTVKVSDGDTLITDGPFAEGKEQLGGFWVITAPDLDAALEWATQASAACRGAVEVRPFQADTEALNQG
jgi:hypothetical protein